MAPLGVDEGRPIRTLLIDNYDSYTFNLHQLIAEVNGVEPTVIRNDDLPWETLKNRLEGGEFDNVVISPGPGNPERQSDIGVGLPLLKEMANVPVLGVCLGHQALGVAHGARVVHAPEPVHGRLGKVSHSGHPMFRGIPQGAEVVRYHSLVVNASSVPACLEPVAWCSRSHGSGMRRLKSLFPLQKAAGASAEHNGEGEGKEGGSNVPMQDSLIMALAHRDRPHFGIQFHPESIGTQYGIALLVNFRDLTASFLGLPPQPPVPNIVGPPGHVTAGRSYGANKSASLSLRWRLLEGVLSELGGTERLFWEMFGSGDARDTFWLDSATAPERGRFSYMGGRGGPLWRRLLYRLPRAAGPEHQKGQPVVGSLSMEHADGRQETLQTPFFDYLAEQLEAWQLSVPEADAAALPFDFWGGYVGYLGYELKAECGGELAHDSSTHDAGFLMADRFLAVDHKTGHVYALAVHDVAAAVEGPAGVQAAEEWLEQTCASIRSMASSNADQLSGSHGPAAECGCGPNVSVGKPPESFRLRHPRNEYIANVSACQQALHDGESYEVCLTTSLRRESCPCPKALYKTLRRLNPAPYSAWLSMGGGGPSICCSSPERFLRCSRGGLLEAKPIKGTAPRVPDDPVADAAAAAGLESSEKDRAENLMITDLLRNDLGRVCEVGTVHVPSLMAIESFATVHQLVSTVRGLRKPGSSVVECLRATYPGGSMTGAPKIRTMEILDKLEGCARGVYSGSLGYISLNDTFDLNIVIRTAVLEEEGMYVGAGGAIVVQSTTEGEYDEMKLKARAILAAVGQCDQAAHGAETTSSPAVLEESQAAS